MAMYVKMNNKKSLAEKETFRAGATFIELMIAMTVTILISGYLFFAYLSIYKGFLHANIRANRVMETLNIKNKIDHIFKDISIIKTANEASFDYSNSTDNDPHSIVFRNNNLMKDAQVEVHSLKKFTYSISDKKTVNNKYLLLWDAILTSGIWIGGAAEVLKE